MIDYDAVLVDTAIPILEAVVLKDDANLHSRANMLLRDAVTKMIEEGETSLMGFVGAASTMTSGRGRVFGLAQALQLNLDAFLDDYAALRLTSCPTCGEEFDDPAAELLAHSQLHSFEAQHPDVSLKTGENTCDVCDESCFASSKAEAAAFHESHLLLHTTEARLAALSMMVERCGDARSHGEEEKEEGER